MECVFSFCSNFALILVHLPRPAENTSEKQPFSSILIFSASAVIHSTFWQNILIGWSQRLNFWNQPDPNKFSVFFNTKIFKFLVIPFSDTGIIISPSNLFCLLLPFAPSCLSSLLLAYLIFSKFVSLLLIDWSQSLTETLPTYLVLWMWYIYERLCLTCPRFFVCLTPFLIIFLFLHCEPLCPNLKLSADNSPTLKSSQFLLTTEANPK